jgi:hypothetical protein
LLRHDNENAVLRHLQRFPSRIFLVQFFDVRNVVKNNAEI